LAFERDSGWIIGRN